MTENEVKTVLKQVRKMENQFEVDIIQMYAMEAAEESIQATAYLEVWHKANDLIALVSDRQKQMLLVLRYLEHLHWDEVADAMEHSLQHINRMHRAALQEIAKKTQ